MKKFVCPKCGSEEFYKEQGVFRCGGCKSFLLTDIAQGDNGDGPVITFYIGHRKGLRRAVEKNRLYIREDGQ